MNDKTGRSSKLRLLLLFLMPGIIILTVVFEIQTNIEKNRANTDASVIINFMKEECVRYEKIYAQDDMEDQFSIEDILTGYKVERAGIIVLTDGERIISSNDLTMRGKTVAENPYIQAFNSYQESKKLVRISKDGKVYYGKYAKCGQYSIYVFLPESEIFIERGMVMAYVAVFYLAAWFVLICVHRKLEKRRIVNLE